MIKSKENSVKWIFSLSDKKTWLHLIFLGLTSIMMGFGAIFITKSIQNFVDIASASIDMSIRKGFLYAFLAVFIYALSIIASHYFTGLTTNQIEKDMRNNMLLDLMDKPILRVKIFHSGEMMTRLTTDIQGVSTFLPNVIGSFGSQIITAILGSIYLFILNWKMAILLICIMLFLVLLTNVFSPILQKRNKIDLENEDNIRAFMQEYLNRLKLFKAYNMKPVVEDKVGKLYVKKTRSKIFLSLTEGLYGFISNFMGFFIMIVTMGVGAYFTLKGDVTIGALIAMIQLSNYVILPISAISRLVSQSNKAISSAQRYNEIMSIEDEDQPNPILQDYANKRIKKLAISNLSFRYNENDRLILNNINATFNTNGVNCIIGGSGAGKSTLINIILGLYKAGEGLIEIVMDDDEIINVDSNFMLHQVAYVPSEDLVYNDTIKNNIIMSSVYEKEDIKKVLELANANGFIDAMPNSINEVIKEAGGNLSAGQAKRIAIARALYKNTAIIIFDEPTANLDAETSQMFLEMIKDISKNKLCIIATHDKEITGISENVFEFDNGTLRRN